MQYLKYLVILLISFLFGFLCSCNTEELQELNIDPTVANAIDPGFILARTQLQTSRSAAWGAQLSYQSTMIQYLASLEEFWRGDKYLYLEGILFELETAASTLSISQPSPGMQDLIYKGDIEKWRKFAYSLMLRMGMKLTKVDPEMAQTWVSKAITGGVMESDDDTNYIQHTDGPESINMNGVGEFLGWDGSNFIGEDNQRLSSSLVDMLAATNDPRLDVLSWVKSGGPHKGLPNGFNAATIQSYPGVSDLETYSRINPLLVLRSSPMIFQTYAEVEFLLAEAVERGWHTGSAATHYTKGLKAAMKLYTLYDASLVIPEEGVEVYLNANPYMSAQWQRIIGEQVWIVTFLNEFEAYANWRRTGYPALVPVDYPGNDSNGTIPRRLRYPEDEVALNGDAYRAAIDRQGPDEFTTRIWWDVE